MKPQVLPGKGGGGMASRWIGDIVGSPWIEPSEWERNTSGPVSSHFFFILLIAYCLLLIAYFFPSFFPSMIFLLLIFVHMFSLSSLHHTPPTKRARLALSIPNEGFLAIGSSQPLASSDSSFVL